MEKAATNNEPQTIMTQSSRNDDTALFTMEDQAERCGFCGRKVVFSQNTWSALDNFSEILFKVLKIGRIRGVVAFFGCNNGDSPVYSMHVHLIRELLARDILVFVGGCISADMNKAGLMETDSSESLGGGLKEFCDYLGLAPVLPVASGAGNSYLDELVGVLAGMAGTESSKLPLAVIVPGGREDTISLSVACDIMTDFDADPDKAADYIDDLIHQKRLGLAWCDQFHCKIHS